MSISSLKGVRAPIVRQNSGVIGGSGQSATGDLTGVRQRPHWRSAPVKALRVI
jgi:hypothetical protein